MKLEINDQKKLGKLTDTWKLSDNSNTNGPKKKLQGELEKTLK